MCRSSSGDLGGSPETGVGLRAQSAYRRSPAFRAGTEDPPFSVDTANANSSVLGLAAEISCAKANIVSAGFAQPNQRATKAGLNPGTENSALDDRGTNTPAGMHPAPSLLTITASTPVVVWNIPTHQSMYG